MPFIKKSNSQDAQPSSPFIGRTGEILFFVHNILQPDAPTHNILSISGQGGVGKSTLLGRFIALTHEAPFKDYCLIAMVDERQATPLGVMEKLAQQLHLTGKFEKTLKECKEALQKKQVERETLRERFFESLPDLAGAVAEGIPVAGPLLREGTKTAVSHLLKEHQTSQVQQDTEPLEIPIDDLTGAFVTELNRLADTNVTLNSTGQKRERRIMLFFDTFEQLAAEATPWFLDHLLATQISGNVVLVVAGRDPIERTSPNGPKHWLPYCDNGTIYWISLCNFTEDETRMYLVKKGISDEDQIATIWHVSQGLPLYLGLLTTNSQGEIDPTKDVVANFLCWIPERELLQRRLALDAALFSKPFNQDDLLAFSYVPESERDPLYQWLVEQPFVRSRSQDGRYLYHDVARELFSRHLYQRSQKHYYGTRSTLVAYYQELLEKFQAERGKEVYHSEEWLELELAVISQLLLLPDQDSHIKAIERVLYASENCVSNEQAKEIRKLLHDLSREPFPSYASSAARKIAVLLLHYIRTDLYSREWLTAADELLERVAQLPSFPSNLLAKIYFRCARAYNGLNRETFNRKLAIENFQQALKFFEETEYYNRGFAQFYSGNFREALVIHNQALEQNPQDANAYFGRGWAYLRLHHYQQAIDDFEYVLKLAPNYANPGGLYNGLRQAYHGAGKYQEALSASDRLRERDPDYYVFRSQCFCSLKDCQQSIDACNHALELAPEYADAYLWRGISYLWLKDLQQAQADLARSCELKTTGIHSTLMAGWVGLCQGATDPSVSERLEAIATAKPRSYFARICRGIAFLLHRHFREASAELEQALLSNYNPKWEAHFWKGVADAFSEKDEEAILSIEKALDLGLPPILLVSLRFFEQEMLSFYGKYALSLQAKYE